MYKRTKIVCTMGPACDSDETIREMIKAGMNDGNLLAVDQKAGADLGAPLAFLE